MITFEKINTLKIIYENAYQSFIAQIWGEQFIEEHQNAISAINYVQLVEEEFYTVLFNNLSDKITLKGYIERVYYEEIVRLYIAFASLLDYYKAGSDKDILQLASGEDGDLYNRIGAHGTGLRLLADKIYSEAQKHGVINLKHYLQIERTDFNFSGQYIALFPLPERKPVRKKDEILFPKDTLKAIFYPNAIEQFIEIENMLIADGYFNEKEWCKDIGVLASMVFNLINKGYLMKKRSKSKAATKKEIKVFFQERYSIDISKQMQPKYMERNKIMDKFPYPISAM